MRGPEWRDKARADLEEEPPAGDGEYLAWLLRQVDAAQRLAAESVDDEDRAFARDVLVEARDELRRLGGGR